MKAMESNMEKGKKKRKEEPIKRVRLIFNTALNSKNRIIAIHSLALTLVTYSFNSINWNLGELKRIDIKIRKQLTIHRMHHQKSDVNRLYIPRNKGNRR